MKIYVLLCAFALAITGCSSSDDEAVPTNNQNNNNNNDPVVELVTIPDAAFEQALIDLGFDTELNGTVPKSSIENIRDIVLNDKNISNLSGIEEFDSLENFWAEDNNLSSVNLNGLSNLKFIFLTNNQLTSINVSGFSNLEKLWINDNQITSLNVSSNINLQILSAPNNQLEAINVSGNPELNVLNVVNNPLTCIQVSSTQLGNIPDQWEKDPEDTYSLNCN